jgi:hypothetical protein
MWGWLRVRPRRGPSESSEELTGRSRKLGTDIDKELNRLDGLIVQLRLENDRLERSIPPVQGEP